jgi:hypothetical protein
MANRKVQFVLCSNDNISTSIVVDETSTVYDAMSISGLLPRDGSLRYALDENGKSLNHCSILDAPEIIKLGLLKNVDSVWGEEKVMDNFVSTERADGQSLLIPNIEVGEYVNVFVTQHKFGKSHYSYRFRNERDPYVDGDIVFLCAPRAGSKSYLFNPKTGKEDIAVEYVCEDLTKIRGFWGCCELQGTGSTWSAKFRPDLSPIPKKFKPHTPYYSVPVSSKGKMISSQQKPIARYKIKPRSQIRTNRSINKGSVRQINGKWYKALIAGNVSRKNSSGNGVLLRSARKNSPVLVNMPHYQDGQQVFVKIPESGTTIELFNIDHPQSPVQMDFEFSNECEVVKGVWAVARIVRGLSNKRMLVIEGFPNSHPPCQI